MLREGDLLAAAKYLERFYRHIDKGLMNYREVTITISEDRLDVKAVYIPPMNCDSIVVEFKQDTTNIREEVVNVRD